MLQKKPKNASFLHNNKNKSKDLDPLLFKIYAGSNSSQRNHKNPQKSKRKPRRNKLHRQDSQTYDFPQFSISFIEHLRKPNPTCTPSQQRAPIAIDHKESIAAKQQPSLKEGIQQQLRKEYYPDFILALAKLYKSMDLFNRGTITELNINNRIDHIALTFCNPVFKKIKEDRLTLTERQFIKLCEPLLKSKEIEELIKFIKVFSPEEENLKVSINLNQSKKELSPIKKRMIEEHIKSNKKNSRLEEVLGAISDKEKEINEKIKDVKERKKTVSFNIQGETNDQPEKKTDDKISKSIMEAREKTSNTNNQINKIFLKPSKENYTDYFVPELAYKLPPNPSTRRRTDTKNILMTTNPNISTSFHNESSINPSSRHINHSNYRQSSIDSKKCQQYLNDDQKISQLTSRIDQYLKRSQSKIQKSKVFTMENSILHNR